MRFGLLILLLLGSSALAASPEDKYWKDRTEAIERLQALARTKADNSEVSNVEAMALAMLKSELLRIVGPVHIEGFSPEPESHLASLIESPEFGLLDGVVVQAPGRREERAPTVVVTTERLLGLWLRDKLKNGHQTWARATASVLKADRFYGDALDPEVGFNSIADLKVTKPGKAAYAVAKFGRFGQRTDSPPENALLVSVVEGGKVFVARAEPQTKFAEAPECSARADAAEKEEPNGANADEDQSPAIGAWFACERAFFATTPAFSAMQRQAQQLADRLGGAR